MNVFKIGWAENTGTLVDLDCRYSLPRVECLVCRGKSELKSWGNGYFQYASFKFEFLNKKEFNFERVLTVPEFEKVRVRIREAAGWPVVVIPGASIGELQGKTATRQLDDFVWGTLCVPQISKRARDILATDGVNLRTADASIRFRGKKIDSHVAVQVEIAPLLSEESLRRFTIKHCPNCDDYDQQNHFLKAPGGTRYVTDILVPEGYLVKRSAWPSGHHLVQSQETLDVFASEGFIASTKRHGLTGIKWFIREVCT